MKKKLWHFLLWIEGRVLDLQRVIDDLWPWLGDHTIHIYWWLQGISMRVFLSWFEGSEDEARDAENLEYGEDLTYYSDRQVRIIEETYGIDPDRKALILRPCMALQLVA